MLCTTAINTSNTIKTQTGGGTRVDHGSLFSGPDPTRPDLRMDPTRGQLCAGLRSYMDKANVGAVAGTDRRRCCTRESASSASRQTSRRNVPPTSDRTATACRPVCTTNVRVLYGRYAVSVTFWVDAWNGGIYSLHEGNTHTHTRNQPFVRDYPCGPVPEETFTHSHLIVSLATSSRTVLVPFQRSSEVTSFCAAFNAVNLLVTPRLHKLYCFLFLEFLEIQRQNAVLSLSYSQTDFQRSHEQLMICVTVCSRDYPCGPVPEETFTHSHAFWSSDILYQLPPSTTLHHTKVNALTH